MKRLLVLLLALLTLAVFTACSETLTPVSTTTAGQTEPPEETVKDVLSFLNKDEIYFDVHLSDGIFDKTSIKVGDQTLTSSGKAKYTGSEEIVFEGKSDLDKEIYLVIISVKAGEKAMSDYSVTEASDFPEMISKRIPIHKTNKEKILVIVTDTKDGYDHSFDSSLSDIIKAVLAD